MHLPTRRVAARASAFIASLIVANAAHAHGATPGTGAFVAGLLHPLTALEHVLPLIALGMLAGQRGLVAGQGFIVAFPVSFAIGALVGAVATPELAALNASTAMIAGGLVALALALPRAALYAIVAGVGVVHGLSNGSAMGQALVPFIAGATLAATVVFAYAFGITHYVLARGASWMPVAVRAVGSWIAAFGILTLALAFVPVTVAGA